MPPLRGDRAEFICVLVWKSSSDSPLGIRFNSYSDGSFRIAGIDEGSLFADTPLAVGDHVVSINGYGCFGNGYQEGLRRLRQKAGAVTVVVQNIGGNPMFVTTSITKPSPNSKLGIKLRNVNGRLYISALGSKRIAAKTLLKPCDRVLVINGVDVRHLASLEALEIIHRARKVVNFQTTSMTRRAPDHAMRVSNQLINQADHIANQLSSYTSTARSMTLSGGSRAEFISAMAWKPTTEARLGIRFQSLDDGSFLISDVDPEGLFGNSALRVGDLVMTINGRPCFGPGYQSALSQARKITGPVTILAHNGRGAKGMVTATIAKTSASTRIGIGFKTIDRKLFVSFCEAPVLSMDDRIVSINGVNCSLMKQSDAAELVRRAQSVVTIVATRMPRPVDPAMLVEATALIINHDNDDESRDADQEYSRYHGLPHAQSVRAITDSEDALSPREETASIEPDHIESGRAQLTSVMVWKPTPETALGLKFMSYDDGSVRISGIDRLGLFANSPLRVGDILVSINDIQAGEDYHRALHLARRVTGAVRIVVRSNTGNSRFVTASIIKPSPSMQLGIGFKNRNGRLCVEYSSISLVDAGGLVLCINGVDCRSMGAMDAAEMIQRALQTVTIKVENQSPSPSSSQKTTPLEVMAEVECYGLDCEKVPCAHAVMAIDENSRPDSNTPRAGEKCLTLRSRSEFISAMVWKATPQTSLGIRFQSHNDGSLRISAIEPDGLFAESPLCVGDFVISINKVSCRGKRYDVALRRVRSTSGSVTIVARNKGGNPAIVTSSVTKPTPATLLGIGFQQNINNRLCVSSLQPQGICGDSLFSSGHKIVSINGVDCRFLSSKLAADMVRLVSDVITIVAEIPVDSGVVVAAL